MSGQKKGANKLNEQHSREREREREPKVKIGQAIKEVSIQL